jgi:hypothetical protein
LTLIFGSNASANQLYQILIEEAVVRMTLKAVKPTFDETKEICHFDITILTNGISRLQIVDSDLKFRRRIPQKDQIVKFLS